jgi:hypothetical protein
MCALLLALPGAGEDRIVEVAGNISPQRIAATMEKLESFRSRDIHAPGAHVAALWLKEQFEAISPRLQVRIDAHPVKKNARMQRDLDVENVVAVLPGRSLSNLHLVIGAHYDSLHLVRREGKIDWAVTAAQELAPGTSDNASGVAAVLEAARAMAPYEWEKTVVFVAFSGEEYGLLGAAAYAERAKKEGVKIEALLNNDIIGNDDNGQGLRASHTVRLYSGDPMDSLSRTLARFVRDVAARHVPSLEVETVFRADRFGRGGDHTPFHNAGFAAVRFTTAAEDLTRQHTANDTLAAASPAYCARVTKVNAAALATLANAPPAPELLPLSRGAKSADAVLQWKPAPHAESYQVLVRSTTAPFWERAITSGNRTQLTLPDVSIDNLVFAVQAVSKDGTAGLPAVWQLPTRMPGAAQP